MMKIALDATPLTVAAGGVRRYTEELSRALAENFPDDQYWLLSDQPFSAPAPRPVNLNVGQVPRNLVERRWWSIGLAAELSRLGIDVFHGTDFAVPYLPARPAVMTVHDLSPWMDPAWHSESSRVRRRTPRLLRWGLANMVITPSEAIRRQAIDRFHLNASRVAAIPLAAARMFRPADVPHNGRPYLLYVGTLEPRKNVGFLVGVWREVRRRHPVDLVLAGRRRSDFEDISPEPGLFVRGFVLDEELPELYSGAHACLYPSCYEGFGLPVLEAMQCGAVVIASRDPAIAEVAGDAAILLNVTDPRAWVETLDALISRPEEYRPFREKAIARAGQFSWSKTATSTREVYAQAAGLFRKG